LRRKNWKESWKLQGWREKIAKGGRYAGFLAEAPVVIVGCGDAKASPRWYAVDTAIAMENMVLAATGEGLSTCWVGSFNEEQIKKMLKIPEKFKVIALLSVGYSRKKFDFLGSLLHLVRPRKPLKKIVSFEEYGKPFFYEEE